MKTKKPIFVANLTFVPVESDFVDIEVSGNQYSIRANSEWMCVQRAVEWNIGTNMVVED